MTLTEQWKKGELPDGYYYMQLPNGDIRIITNSLITNCNGFSILAPVPSYNHFVELTEKVKENQQLRKWCEEFNALEVAKENEQLKLIIKRTKASGNYPGRVSAYKVRIINLSEENQQLKELLKECRERLGDYAEFCIKGGYLNAEDEAVKMITKIDNVIGEKK